MISKRNILSLIISIIIPIMLTTLYCHNIYNQIQAEKQNLSEINAKLSEIKSELEELESKVHTNDAVIEITEEEQYNNDDSNDDVAIEITEADSYEFNNSTLDVTITAYDLSLEDCEKDFSDPYYGITASGKDLKGHTLESARVIAVDPDIIPLGSEVYVSFHDEEYQHLNGTYTAEDVGGAIQGHKIDLFFGDPNYVSTDIEINNFGRRKATITIL